MKTDHRKLNLVARGLVFFFMTAMIFSTGCGSVSQIVEKTKSIDLPFTSSRGELRKKVGVAPLVDLTKAQDRRLSKELASLIMENLASKCSHSSFVLPDDSQQTLFLDDLPKNTSGEIDGLVLARMGREAGLNAVVVMNIGGIAVEKKKSGLIGFRKSHDHVRIWVKLEVYDTHTGAKFMFDSLSVEIKPEEDETIDNENVSSSLSVMEALIPFSKTIGKSICKALEPAPWRGFVISVENGKAVISSGADAGVGVGDVFDVFTVDKTIDNVSGQQFRMPGKKIDEITITSVAANRSEGASVSGREIPADAVVQVKKD